MFLVKYICTIVGRVIFNQQIKEVIQGILKASQHMCEIKILVHSLQCTLCDVYCAMYYVKILV